jgi:PAS domain S-box-containing protein
MKDSVLILYLEDDSRDAELVWDTLRQAGLACDLQVVNERTEYEVALVQTRFGLILSDYRVPGYDGLAALAFARAQQPDVPFILVSGDLGEEQAVDCLLHGATDYVLKQRLGRLVPAVTRALAQAEERRQRRRAEVALRESEARYRLVSENGSDVIWLFDLAANRFAYVSPSVERQRGYTAAEVCEQPLPETMTPESYRMVQEVLAVRLAAFAAGEDSARTQTHELVQTCRDGSTVPTEVVTTLVANASGRVTHIQGVSRDITERKQAEQVLQLSERRFRALTEHAPDGVVLVSAQGVMTFASPSARRMFGVGLDDPLPFDPNAFTHPEDLPRVLATLADLQHNPRQVRTLQYRCRHLNGTWIWVESAFTNLLGLPGVDAIVINFRHIDDRKQAELALTQLNAQLEQRVAERTAELLQEIAERKQAEAQLRKLWSAVEQSATVVVITDREGTIEYVNPRFEAQTGYPAAAVVGQKPRLLKSGVHPPAFYTELWQTLLAGRTWQGEVCNRRRDRTLFWEAMTIAPIRDGAGPVTHFVAIKEDITERRRAAAELLQAKDAADAANRAKSRFLANMSHEIRTPMNAILGFAQLLQRDATLTARQRRQLSTINRSGEHLLQLINDILDMSKIESGRLQLTTAECDFHGLLADLEALFRLRTEEKGLRFEVTHTSGVPARLCTDAGKVRQVLLNILSNAVKFSARGCIRLGVTATPVLASAADPAAVCVGLAVTDTGVGIAPEELERVFEPFEQTQSGQRQGGGTGLGMAISRQLARLLGGDLTVTSQLGEGSVFHFTFVARVLALAPTTPAHAGGAGQVLGLKPGAPAPLVLVVDDQESNRHLLRDLLAGAGFAVGEAADGTVAVARCAAERPALVLLDRQLPGLDGLTATRAIRAGPAGRTTRILLVSADVLGTEAADWQAAGADGFMGKPIECEALLAQVGALLGLEYRYTALTATAGGPPELARATLAALPAALRAAIGQATEAGDVAQLQHLVAHEVTPRDPAAGQVLGQLAANYDYTAILAAVCEQEHDD